MATRASATRPAWRRICARATSRPRRPRGTTAIRAEAPVEQELVLVGGGHSHVHVHVLKSFGMRPVPGVRVTLVARDVETPYSGMLPGLIAGHYTREETHIDLRRLARFAGVGLVHAEAVGIREARRVLCRGRPAVRYDLLSLDIGSTPKREGVPGAEDHTVPIKPIDGF